jgi:hypothetical protein
MRLQSSFNHKQKKKKNIHTQELLESGSIRGLGG